jgi:hypothetical protein
MAFATTNSVPPFPTKIDLKLWRKVVNGKKITLLPVFRARETIVGHFYLAYGYATSFGSGSKLH